MTPRAALSCPATVAPQDDLPRVPRLLTDGQFLSPGKMLAAGHHHGQSGLGSVSAGRVRRSAEGGAMSAQQRGGAAADLSPGKVVGAGRYAVGDARRRRLAGSRPWPDLRAGLSGGE